MADFDLGGLLFGNAPSSGLEGYLDPEQLKRMQQQGVMQAAMALLKASGPSTRRVGLGQALGEAYGAGQAGYQQAQQQGLAAMMTKQKMEEAKRNQELQQTVGTFLGQEAPEGVSPTEFKAQQYMKLADLYAARNPEQASKFFDMAQKLTPTRAKVSGQPFEVSGPDGKPILVQQNEFGDIITMQGFGPKRKVVLQNIDGVMTAVDESALKGGETFGTGISKAEQARIDADNTRLAYELKRLGFDEQRIAMEKKRLGMEQQRLGISQAEFARGGYEIKETPEGFAYVPKSPGGTSIPIMGAAGTQLMPPIKEAPAAFSEAVKKLNNLKGNLSAYKTEVESNTTVFPSEVPLPFGAKIPLPTGSDTARMRGKYQSLLMGVKDLYDLGALTGPDMGIIEQQLTNPASFSGMFTSRAAMNEQIKVLEDMATRAEENLSSTYKRKIPEASKAGNKNITVDY
jgi:hypothetical protein